MKPLDALEVLKQAAELALLSKKDHVAVEHAFQLIRRFLEEKLTEIPNENSQTH